MAKIIFRLIISITFITLCFYNVNLLILVKAFTNTNILFFFISTAFGLSNFYLLASKHKVLIRQTAIDTPIQELVKINFISRFYAMFIPTSLGQEIVRWYKVTKNKQYKGFFLGCIFIERFFFLIFLIAFGTIPILFFVENSQLMVVKKELVTILSYAVSICSIMLICYLIPSINNYIKNIVKRLLNRSSFEKIRELLLTIDFKHFSVKHIASIIVLTLIGQFLYLFRMHLLFLAVGLSLSFIDMTWMASIVLLLQVLPISFSGIGVRESTYAFCLSLYNLNIENGVIIGCLFFIQMLIYSGIGAVFAGFDKS